MLLAITRRLGRALVMLSLAGAVIGLLHKHDVLLALLLAGILPLAYQRLARSSQSRGQRQLILAGMLLSGLLGVQVELWGIDGGHWAYHDLPEGRYFPYWLPCAWALAFAFLYRLELDFVRLMDLVRPGQKLLLAVLLAATFPTWGEVITIALGVWTYSWGYQLLGVPMLAVGLLVVFHVGIFALLVLVCRLARIEDPVFGNCRQDGAGVAVEA